MANDDFEVRERLEELKAVPTDERWEWIKTNDDDLVAGSADENPNPNWPAVVKLAEEMLTRIQVWPEFHFLEVGILRTKTKALRAMGHPGAEKAKEIYNRKLLATPAGKAEAEERERKAALAAAEKAAAGLDGYDTLEQFKWTENKLAEAQTLRKAGKCDVALTILDGIIERFQHWPLIVDLFEANVYYEKSLAGKALFGAHAAKEWDAKSQKTTKR